MPGSGRCSILKGLPRQTRLVDPFRNLQVGPAGVVEQFGQVQAHGRSFIEQKLFEHRLVDSDHLLHVVPGEVHGGARMFAGLMLVKISLAGPEANYATASYSDGASQEPSIRNITAGSVLAEIAFSGGVSSLTSSMYGSG